MVRQYMESIKGFSPIIGDDASILILGSMPSETSLQKQQYYGHKRNAFWPIMLSLLTDKNDQERSYEQRKVLLMNHNIAVWDVLQSCHRVGSLDAAIKMDALKTNDFLSFFSKHRTIRKVFFNGGKAKAVFFKHVLPTVVSPKFSHLRYISLPSTSPAYASMTLMQKTAVWKKELGLI